MNSVSASFSSTVALTLASPRTALPLTMDRRLLIVTTVVGIHLFALWALNAGLVRRAVELVIPVQVLAEVIEPPEPAVELPEPVAELPEPAPAPLPVRPPRPPVPQPVPSPPPPPPPPAAPAPVSSLAPPLAPSTVAPAREPAAATPSIDAVPQAAAPEPLPAPATPAPPAAPASSPAPPLVELPSSSADFLGNPKATYPTLSGKLGEEGTVVVRARIEVNGTASQAEVLESSGYPRLDKAAVRAARQWRYVPGKRAGVPEAMWVNIPIQFALE